MQHQIPAARIPQALHPRRQCSPKMWQPRTPAKRRSTSPHQCRGLVDTASQESCWSFSHAVYTQRRNSTRSLQHDTHNLKKKQVDTQHHVGLHCCVYPVPHIHAAPDPCSTDSSGPTSQATCSAAPKCGSLGPPQRGGQPRRTNAGGWSTQPRRSHVGHSLMLCIPSAETAPDPCSMDHDTHNLKKKQVDTHHHVGLHRCVYPAPHIHAAPDPCSTDSSGPTSQATCSAAPQCGSLGPPQ